MLSNLRRLYLADSPVNDYSPLANIYPNLENKDFFIASTLQELGFSMDGGIHQAKYANESFDVIINHAEWGYLPMEWDANCVRISLPLEDDYTLKGNYYPELDTYVFGMGKNGEALMNYVYDLAIGDFTFRSGDRASSEQAVRGGDGRGGRRRCAACAGPHF